MACHPVNQRQHKFKIKTTLVTVSTSLFRRRCQSSGESSSLQWPRRRPHPPQGQGSGRRRPPYRTWRTTRSRFRSVLLAIYYSQLLHSDLTNWTDSRSGLILLHLLPGSRRPHVQCIHRDCHGETPRRQTVLLGKRSVRQ